MIKKAIFLILSLGLIVSFTQPVFAVDDDSGSCGDNVTYTFTAADGKLVISGSGEMMSASYATQAPWNSYSSAIKTVSIGIGVANICYGAFYYCTNLSSVTIPNTVKSIHSAGFFYCKALTSVSIPDSVTSIGSSAFSACIALTSVVIGNGVTFIDNYAFDRCYKLTSVTYKGTSDPGASSTNVFAEAAVTTVKVPWNYKDSTFCGVSISKLPAPTKSPSRSRSPMATPSKSPTASPSNNFTAPLDYFERKLKTTTIFVCPMLYHALALE